jgi:hypothetical protein
MNILDSLRKPAAALVVADGGPLVSAGAPKASARRVRCGFRSKVTTHFGNKLPVNSE